MALKKPSELFDKKETSSVFETPEVTPHITESYNKFVDNFKTVNEIADKTKVFDKVDELSERIELLSKELSEKLTRTDLENAMLSQLMVLDENFKTIQSQVKGLNKEDLIEFKSKASDLFKVVNNVKENITDIREEIDEKFDSIAEVIDNNLEYFNSQLQETSSKVKKTADTYNKLSKIVENKVTKENEKLEEYSQIIESLEKSFLDFSYSLKEQLEESSQLTEEKFEEYKIQFENISTGLEKSIDKHLDSYQKEILDIKADVVIFEKHNKDTEKTIQEFSGKLSKISNETIETKKDLEVIEEYIQTYRQDIVKLKEEVLTEIDKLPVGNLQENVERLEKKIDYIKETYSKIEPEVIVKEIIKEGLLNEPPETDNSDPLTPLNQNFVTLDQLQEHYRLFINRIQQQLSTLGGGGETRLKYLDDIVGIATNASAYDGKYLKYNHSIGKFEFVTVSAGGSQTLDQTLQLGNTSSLGMSVGVITATSFDGNATSATYATTAGVSTSVIGGIGSVTQLRVSGVSTLGITTFTGAVSFGTSAYFGTDDNLVLGNGNNLQIYYNGSSGIIDATNGPINIKGTTVSQTSDAHVFYNEAGTRTLAAFLASGATFYFNNNNRLEINSAGITVTGLTSTNSLRVSGVTTSTGGFVGDLTGNASSATYATTAGVSTYATTAGIATYATTSGVSTTSGYATSSGIATYATTAGVSTTSGYSTTSGIATYATTAGVSTYATTAGVSTSVIGGISSVTQLQVTGVSTFTNGPVLVGSGTSTGTASQRLQVTGGGYFSGNVGIGTTLSNEALSVLPKIQILNNSNADGRLIFRAKPGNAYRWNIDNDGDTNNLRFFKEDDANAANGSSPFEITPTGNARLTGNLNAAGNYYVKLARTSNQTINNGSDTLIGFSAMSDPNSWFNSGNNRITPTVAGNYCINAMVKWEAGAATNTVQSNIQIRRNGNTVALSVCGVQTHTYTMNINAIVTMDGSTDYVEFTVYTGNPTSQVVGGDAGGTLTKLELFKLN